MTDPLRPEEPQPVGADAVPESEPLAPLDPSVEGAEIEDAAIADPELAALVAADMPETAEAQVVPAPPPPQPAPPPAPALPPIAPPAAPPIVVAAPAPAVVRQTVVAAPPRRGVLYVIRRVVAFLFGLLQALLILRILLLLLNANMDNDIVDWIMRVTQPFIDPFLGMFNLDSVTTRQGSVLDIAAIVALVAWTLIETLVVSVLRLFDRRR